MKQEKGMKMKNKMLLIVVAIVVVGILSAFALQEKEYRSSEAEISSVGNIFNKTNDESDIIVNDDRVRRI